MATNDDDDNRVTILYLRLRNNIAMVTGQICLKIFMTVVVTNLVPKSIHEGTTVATRLHSFWSAYPDCTCLHNDRKYCVPLRPLTWYCCHGGGTLCGG